MNRWTGVLTTVLCLGGALHAQNCGTDSKTLSGTVLDPSGAAIVGANVRLQAPRQKKQRRASMAPLSSIALAMRPTQ